MTHDTPFLEQEAPMRKVEGQKTEKFITGKHCISEAVGDETDSRLWFGGNDRRQAEACQGCRHEAMGRKWVYEKGKLLLADRVETALWHVEKGSL